MEQGRLIVHVLTSIMDFSPVSICLLVDYSSAWYKENYCADFHETSSMNLN